MAKPPLAVSFVRYLLRLFAPCTLGLSSSQSTLAASPSVSTCHGGAEPGGCSCDRAYFHGAWSGSTADLLPDLLLFLKTHRGIWSLLLQAASCNEALAKSLVPCSCARLCLNQCLSALLAQGFPSNHKLELSPRKLPSWHREWECFRSANGRRIVWMAQNQSSV